MESPEASESSLRESFLLLRNCLSLSPKIRRMFVSESLFVSGWGDGRGSEDPGFELAILCGRILGATFSDVNFDFELSVKFILSVHKSAGEQFVAASASLKFSFCFSESLFC